MANEKSQTPIATGTIDLVGHTILDAGLAAEVTNLIIKAKTQQGRWIEAVTSEIGPARALFRSTYIHWALAINGLHLAAERYGSTEWQSKGNVFQVTGHRRNDPKAVLACWEGNEASKAHLATVPKMSAWGYIEIYALLEFTIMKLYRDYWNIRPDGLLKGREFLPLRKLKAAAEAPNATPDTVESWNQAWNQRLDKWHKNKIYDGLHRVFLAFCKETRLKTPSHYKVTTLETWAESIEGLALIRNLLIHGATVVPPELEIFCSKPHSMGFKFE